jgi:hypothetical protein
MSVYESRLCFIILHEMNELMFAVIKCRFLFILRSKMKYFMYAVKNVGFVSYCFVK